MVRRQFRRSGGSTYTDPPGEFSTLVANSGGGYTRTLTDGTKITFNSNGQETATIDTNGLHTTYTYNSGGSLTKITDPYDNVTTFTYNSGGTSSRSPTRPAASPPSLTLART